MLYGRVGLVSLGQVAPYGIGTWVTMRLAFATSLPYPVLLIIAGLVAALLGVLIGLPALAGQRLVPRTGHSDARRWN